CCVSRAAMATLKLAARRPLRRELLALSKPLGLSRKALARDCAAALAVLVRLVRMDLVLPAASTSAHLVGPAVVAQTPVRPQPVAPALRPMAATADKEHRGPVQVPALQPALRQPMVPSVVVVAPRRQVSKPAPMAAMRRLGPRLAIVRRLV